MTERNTEKDVKTLFKIDWKKTIKHGESKQQRSCTSKINKQINKGTSRQTNK